MLLRTFAAASVALTTALVMWVILGAVPKPVLVNPSGFSTAVCDRDGQLLRLTCSSDESYRLWVPIADIPAAMIDATLIQEDAWFRWHPGVNPLSLARAFFATYLRRGRRIGGSTITMQLARYRFGINSRTLRGKLEQIARAIQVSAFIAKTRFSRPISIRFRTAETSKASARPVSCTSASKHGSCLFRKR
jgi:penicillin-binding protein 1C